MKHTAAPCPRPEINQLHQVKSLCPEASSQPLLPRQMDWALQHHSEHAFQNITTGNWKPLVPLPEPLPDGELAAPPAPTFMLLTLNKRDNSLKMPDKVMTKWHDHAESDFSAVFRQKYEECKQRFPLDIPNPKREADGGGEDGGSANKKTPNRGKRQQHRGHDRGPGQGGGLQCH